MRAELGGTGGVQACRGGRTGAGKKPFCSSSESWALSDPALRPNIHQVKLSSQRLLRRKAMHLKGEKRSHLLLASPLPSPLTSAQRELGVNL